jgi:prepilin-type N-terminal cleavage/methylation domain-containing protein
MAFCASTRARGSRHHSGFSIIELLTVIAIIGVLIGILLPSMGRAREMGNRVVCSSRLRTLGQAFIAFSNDHEGSMPGGCYDTGNSDPSRRDWAMGNVRDYRNAPQNGTIFRYVAKSYETYRCPNLDVISPGGGVGSNGRFDYTIPISFPGVQRALLPSECRFTYPDGSQTSLPTPILVEEDPAKHMNSASMEASWGSIDEFTKTHAGGGQYAGVDGSVIYFKAPAGCNTRNWTCKSPTGKWLGVGIDSTWGWWNTQ